ncbi:hypothetical protein [Sorangium sp. So ce128]|uniref:hypothetical protein n=1 Tax=Sorangium sp. So ce128 TaxID=3133281 RepID=UPI003F61EBAE
MKCSARARFLRVLGHVLGHVLRPALEVVCAGSLPGLARLSNYRTAFDVGSPIGGELLSTGTR